MRKFKFNSKRLLVALAGGVMLNGLYKLYLYTNDREQFNDSNALVSAVSVLIAASLIFLFLELASSKNSAK